MADARETAVRALMAVDRGAWSDLYLASAIKKAGLDRRDAALCTAICAGVLQNKELLDYHIAAYSSLRLNKISPFILNILRAAAYQIEFMDRVPNSAAVNTAVTLIRNSGSSRASSFANAVLRRISENCENLPLPDKNNYLKYLSVKYSHPQWLIEYFISIHGNEGAERLLKMNNEAPPVVARVNTLRGSAAEAYNSLEIDGVGVKPHEFLQNALYLEHSGNISELDAYKSGLITIQDTASQLCVYALSPEAGHNVLDACSAPGGKTFAASALMGNCGSITSCDINAARINLIRRDAERLSAEIVKTREADGGIFIPEFENSFDRVLADVPCSGMGVIRRKPEIRYKSREDIALLTPVQKGILYNTSRYLKTGGIMVYSTCSVMPEENGDIIDVFLKENNGFEPVDFTLPGGISSENGRITLWPHKNNTDGFFIAKMIKRT